MKDLFNFECPVNDKHYTRDRHGRFATARNVIIEDLYAKNEALTRTNRYLLSVNRGTADRIRYLEDKILKMKQKLKEII